MMRIKSLKIYSFLITIFAILLCQANCLGTLHNQDDEKKTKALILAITGQSGQNATAPAPSAPVDEVFAAEVLAAVDSFCQPVACESLTSEAGPFAMQAQEIQFLNITRTDLATRSEDRKKELLHLRFGFLTGQEHPFLNREIWKTMLVESLQQAPDRIALLRHYEAEEQLVQLLDAYAFMELFVQENEKYKFIPQACIQAEINVLVQMRRLLKKRLEESE